MLKNPDIFRALVAIVIGLAAATVLIGAWQVTLWWLWSPGPADASGLIPSGVLLLLLPGYIIGAALGGGVAARLANPEAGVCALAVGAIQTAAAVVTVSSEVHPEWFMLFSPLVHLPSALAGARVALGRWPFPLRQ